MKHHSPLLIIVPLMIGVFTFAYVRVSQQMKAHEARDRACQCPEVKP